jgi:hypothetical protein
MPSLGLTGAAITGIKYGIPRLVNGLVGNLFREDVDAYYRELLDYADPELKTLEGPFEWIDRLASEAIAGLAESDGGLAGLLAQFTHGVSSSPS